MSSSPDWCMEAHSHFGQHVAHKLAVVVLGHKKQLGPGEDVIEIILRMGYAQQRSANSKLLVQGVSEKGR